jgi:PKD repeat protein
MFRNKYYFLLALFITSLFVGTVSGDIPVASFVSNVTNGMNPLVVQFTDSSTNTPTSWNWSFGDGNFSEEQNPVYWYNYTGLYTVNLTATNAGGSDDESKVDYINATEEEAPPSPVLSDCFTIGGDFESYEEYWGYGEIGYEYGDVTVEITDDWNDPHGIGAHSGDSILYINITAPPDDEAYFEYFYQEISLSDYDYDDNITKLNRVSFYYHIENYTTTDPYAPTYFEVEGFNYGVEKGGGMFLAHETDGWTKVSIDLSPSSFIDDATELGIYFSAFSYAGGHIEVWIDDVCYETDDTTCGINGGDFESGDIDDWLWNTYTNGDYADAKAIITDFESNNGDYSAYMMADNSIEGVDTFAQVMLYQYLYCCHEVGTVDFAYKLSDTSPVGTTLEVFYEYALKDSIWNINDDFYYTELLSTDTCSGEWIEESVELENMSGFGRLVFLLTNPGEDTGTAEAWIDDVSFVPYEYPSPVYGIVNGGFEEGTHIGWCFYENSAPPELPGTIDVREVDYAYSGDYVARLHTGYEYYPHYVTMSQDIASTDSNTVTFAINISNFDIGEEGYGYVYYLIGSIDDYGYISEIDSVYHEYTEETGGWIEEVVDISSVQNRTNGIRIFFECLAGENYCEIEAFIDDVRLDEDSEPTPCLDCPTQVPMDRQLESSFERSPKIGDCPLTVTFTDVSESYLMRVAGSYEYVEQPYTRTWNFGDGTIVTNGDAVVEHTYYYPGKYSVELTISEGNMTSTASRYNSVYVTGAIFPNPTTTTFGEVGEDLQYAQYNITEYTEILPLAYTGLFNTDAANALFIFWGLVFMFIFLAIFIRVDDVSLLLLFGLIVAGTILALLPSDFRFIGQGFLVLALASVIYILIKGRFK